MNNLSAFGPATHVAFDSFTTERLLQLGATDPVRASDNLLIGPCRRDPAEHERVREAWWSSSEKWDRLYSPEVRWKTPVVLWVSASISQRVNLWRACHWLRQKGIATRDVLIVEVDPLPPPKAPEEPMPPWDARASVSDHPDAVLLASLAQARPFSQAHYDQAVSLWDSVADEDPLPFVETCLRGLEGFAELADVWALLSCFFPRRTAQGALCVSRFDELLLTILSTEPQSPVSVFVHKSGGGLALRHILSCVGDLFLPRRLDQWATHGSSPAVEREPGRRPDNPMLASVYRISESGMRLRQTDLGHLTDAPSLPVAGTEAYGAGAPWVLLDDGRLVRP